LIRLHAHRVDERQREVSRLAAMRRDLEAKIQDIEAALEAERAASAGAGAIYAAFAEGAQLRRAELAARRAAVQADLDDAHRALNAAFHELKKFELLETLRIADEKRQAAQRERARMDEIGLRRAARDRS